MSEDLSAEFDPPIIESITGLDTSDRKKPVEVSFARADMDYLTQWASAMKQKRILEGRKIINTMAGLGVQEKIVALRKLEAEPVSIFQVMDQRLTGEGIKKFLDDAMQRAGCSDAKFRERVRRRLGFGRQYAIVEDILSEPKPTLHQFRDAVRERCLRDGMAREEVEALSDEQLIELAAKPTGKEPSISLRGEGGDADDADPLSESGESEPLLSTTGSATR